MLGRISQHRPVPIRATRRGKKGATPPEPTPGAGRAPRRTTAPSAPRTAYRRAPLASLRVFVAVAEHKSFTRGADALGVTASAASMQVQALEDYLRVPLLRRNGRQVELTPQGALLRPKVEQALADLERAIDEARADRGSGPLRVTTIASFLAQWLLPRLPDFTSHHTGIDVQIHTSTELVDFVKTGMDAAIRFGAGSWPRLHVQKLFDEWLVPVCTPALLQRDGPIAEARDRKRSKLLHSTYEPWTAWLLEGGPDEEWPTSCAACDGAIAIVRAAQSVLSPALGPGSLYVGAMARGGLANITRALSPVPRTHL